MDDSLTVDLGVEERELLARGLAEWGGPASATDALARVIGFADVRALRDDGRRIAEALRAGDDLEATDWRRALCATEVAFGSDVYGSGVDWPTTTGLSDEETIIRLRAVLRKLIRITGVG
jgi:hypothetical protein